MARGGQWRLFLVVFLMKQCGRHPRGFSFVQPRAGGPTLPRLYDPQLDFQHLLPESGENAVSFEAFNSRVASGRYFFFELFFAPFLAAFLAAFFLATVRPPLNKVGRWAVRRCTLQRDPQPRATKSQPLHKRQNVCGSCAPPVATSVASGGTRSAIHSFSSCHWYDSNAVTTSCLYLPFASRIVKRKSRNDAQLCAQFFRDSKDKVARPHQAWHAGAPRNAPACVHHATPNVHRAVWARCIQNSSSIPS